MLKYDIPHKGYEQEYHRRQSRAARERDPISRIFATAKYRAKKRGIEFSVKRNEIYVPTHCPVFGTKLEVAHGRRKENSFSLDRKDNSKGYTKENVCVISWRANQMKGDLSVEEVEHLLTYMKGELV